MVPLVKSGLREDEVKKVFHNEVDHAAVLKEVEAIRDNEVAEWLAVRGNKVTEEMWEYYEATGERGLIECRQMRAAVKALRKAWRTRVKPFHAETASQKAASRRADAQGAAT